MFEYHPFGFTKEGMSLDEKYEVLASNRSILSDGVVIDGKPVECIEVREPSRGERIDYEQFAPAGSMLSSVEVYANGAKNIFVRSKLLVYVIGVITVRPMLAYNAEKEYKPLTF
jgi:hypothetical protein